MPAAGKLLTGSCTTNLSCPVKTLGLCRSLIKVGHFEKVHDLYQTLSNKFSGRSKACDKVKPNLLVCKMSQHLDTLFFSTTSKVKTYHAINVGRKSQQKKGATGKRINTFC